MTLGGSAQPVVVSTAAPNAGPAIPIAVVSDGRPLIAGPCQTVVQVSDGRPVLAAPPMPVYVATGQQAGNVLAGPPIPVYVVSGSLNPSTLLNGLGLYLKNDEVLAVPHVDSSGSVTDFTNNNTVLGLPGQIGNAANLVALSNQYLSHADVASLSMGDNDFEISVGFFALLKLTQSTIVAKGDGNVANATEYALYLTVNSLQFDVMNGVATGSKASGALSLSTWYHAHAWHDSVANTVNLQINGGAVLSAAYSGGSYDSARPIEVGRWPVFNSWYFNGLIDEVKIWPRRILTTAERAEDYANFVAGRPLF